MHVPSHPPAVGRREQAHIAHHQGALYKAASLRLGATQPPGDARRGRGRVHVVLVGLLDRLMHGRGGVLVRQDGALRARDVRRRPRAAHVHLVPQGPVLRLAARPRAA